MEPRYYLRLCTFEVATPLGRRQRLGSFMDGRVVDLNFATAWYMAETGEPDPQSMADALVPSTLAGYLRAGLRAVFTAEELFLGAGPPPAHWWRWDSPPMGPNGETLVYPRENVSILGLFGAEENKLRPGDCEWELAAVMDARRTLAGYTLFLRNGSVTRVGPYLITPAEIGDPTRLDWTARINGQEVARGKIGSVLKPDPTLDPGEMVRSGPLGGSTLKPGDMLELEAERIGALRAAAA